MPQRSLLMLCLLICFGSLLAKEPGVEQGQTVLHNRYNTKVLSSEYGLNQAPTSLLFKLKTSSSGEGDKRGITPEQLKELNTSKLEDVVKRYGLSDVYRIGPRSRGKQQTPQTYKAAIPDGTTIEQIMKQMKVDPDIVWVEPDYIRHAQSIQPDDSSYIGSQQSYLSAINLENAWGISTGSKNVVVAVIDSGVNYNHEDLKDNIWHNPGEIPGNGIDDDGNGYVDDVIGWDFIDLPAGFAASDEDGTTPDNDPMDVYGHGTFVAGIIGAKGNNNTGVAGVAWNVGLMVLKAGYKKPDGEGIFNSSFISEALYYACDNGADIVNMSFGDGETRSQIEMDALEYCKKQGVLLVAASGNDKKNIVNYPAAYESVIAVAAADSSLQDKAFVSNYGPWIDITAPGEYLYSTTVDGDYGSKSGTSVATPVVTGVAALIKSRWPDYTADEIASHLLASAKGFNNISSDFSRGLGAGLVQAILDTDTGNLPPHVQIVSVFSSEAGSTHDDAFDAGETITLEPSVHNYSSYGLNNITIKLTSSDPYISILDDTITLSSLAANSRFTSLQDNLQFKVLDNVPVNHILEYKLTISNDSGVIDSNTAKATLNPLFRNLVELSDSDLSYSKVVHAEHSNGSISFIFQSDSSSDNELYYRMRFADGSWGEVQSVPNSIGYRRYAPSIVVDDNNIVHVVFKQAVGDLNTNGLDETEVYYAKYDLANDYWDIKAITKGAGINTSNINSTGAEVKIILDGGGNPHIAWSDWRDGTADIYTKVYDGTGWLDEEIAQDVNAESIINLNYYELKNGMELLLWNQDGNLYSSTKSNGNWSVPVFIDQATNYANTVKDSNDNVHLVYLKNIAYKYSIFNGNTWSVPTAIGDFDCCYLPFITVDSLDRPEIYLTESKYSNGITDGIFKTAWNGTGWNAQELVYPFKNISIESGPGIFKSKSGTLFHYFSGSPSFSQFSPPVFLMDSERNENLYPKPPIVTVVRDNGAINVRAELEDNGQPDIKGYRVVLGTVPGKADILPRKNLVTDSLVEFDFKNTNLFSADKNYFVSAQVLGSNGYWSPVATNGGVIRINKKPVVSIDFPTNNAVVNENDIKFSGSASDLEDGDLSDKIKWYSNVNLYLGMGKTLLQPLLNLEPHTITASVTDSDGSTVTSEINITINAKPNTVISSIIPAEGGGFYEGYIIDFTGSAIDPEDGDLTDSIQWVSSIDGLLGYGGVLHKSLTAGEHLITATVVDSMGAIGQFKWQLGISYKDSDGDGIPDKAEIKNGLDPNNPDDAYLDNDQDGLVNVDEYSLGTSINLADTDGDGVNDGTEVAQGRSPLVNETTVMQILESLSE